MDLRKAKTREATPQAPMALACVVDQGVHVPLTGGGVRGLTPPPGAEAFKRDVSRAVVRFFDTGHFALETHAAELAAIIRGFLAP
jgi:hypothetical protein